MQDVSVGHDRPENLPPIVKAALAYGADIVFLDFPSQATADPAGLAATGELTMYFQGFNRGLYNAHQAAVVLRALAPWITADLVVTVLARSTDEDTADDLACDFVDEAFLRAAVSFAQAILYLAGGRAPDVPEAAAAHRVHLDLMAAELASMIARGDSTARASYTIFGWLAD